MLDVLVCFESETVTRFVICTQKRRQKEPIMDA